MTDESFKKLLEAQEAIRRQLEPLSSLENILGPDNIFSRIAQDMTRNRDLMRAALGPIEELRRSGMIDSASQIGRQLQDIAEQATKGFSLPDITEKNALMRAYNDSNAANALNHYHDLSDQLQLAMGSMRSPWLDLADKMRSFGGFAELQSIGLALRTFPAFDTQLTDMLRTDLGDWQDLIDWPEKIFIDPLARTEFYTTRGFNSALTTLPVEAFEQSIDIAGLKSAPPPLIATYYHEDETENDDEEAAFVRTNAAHDRLQRFETQLRRFIDEQMRAAFGDQWIKHRIPGNIRQSWLDKWQTARDNGEPELPLIAHADFTDYLPIIIRKDNWTEVFRPIFKRQTFVQESFQRLFPIRNCTMHTRMITQDDELYLYVETKRILSAIGIIV